MRGTFVIFKVQRCQKASEHREGELIFALLKAIMSKTSVTGNVRLQEDAPCAEPVAHSQTISKLCTSVVQRQEDPFVQAGSVEVPRNGFSCPTVQLQLLWVWRVGVGLSQDVPIPVFIEGVLQGVTVGRQALRRKQRVAAGHKKDRRASHITSRRRTTSWSCICRARSLHGASLPSSCCKASVYSAAK